jgi:hypothetical protein
MSTTPIADMWREAIPYLHELLHEEIPDGAGHEFIMSMCRKSYFAGAMAAVAAISGWDPDSLQYQCNQTAIDRVINELTREYLTEEPQRESAQGSEVRH